MGFLGHWLMPAGVKPWKKKAEIVLKMGASHTTSQLWLFLGAVACASQERVVILMFLLL